MVGEGARWLAGVDGDLPTATGGSGGLDAGATGALAEGMAKEPLGWGAQEAKKAQAIVAKQEAEEAARLQVCI